MTDNMQRLARTVFLVALVLSSAVSAPLSTEEKDYEDLTQPIAAWTSDHTHDVLLRALETLLSRHFLSRDRTSSTARLEAGSSAQKRGLGRCIYDCMHSGGGLNFIQCKTMCY